MITKLFKYFISRNKFVCYNMLRNLKHNNMCRMESETCENTPNKETSNSPHHRDISSKNI